MIYEYHCEACKKDFEIEHSMKDKPKKKCPDCKKNKLKRLISFNKNQFVLAGDCWEKDGYKSKGNKQP